MGYHSPLACPCVTFSFCLHKFSWKTFWFNIYLQEKFNNGGIEDEIIYGYHGRPHGHFRCSKCRSSGIPGSYPYLRCRLLRTYHFRLLRRSCFRASLLNGIIFTIKKKKKKNIFFWVYLSFVLSFLNGYILMSSLL